MGEASAQPILLCDFDQFTNDEGHPHIRDYRFPRNEFFYPIGYFDRKNWNEKKIKILKHFIREF